MELTKMTGEQDNTGLRDSGGRWVAGSSGNYAGRPKNSLTTILKDHLAKSFIDSDGKLKTYADKIVEIIIDKALSGDLRAIIEIWNRVDGRPAQAISISQNEPVDKIVVEFINSYDATKDKEGVVR